MKNTIKIAVAIILVLTMGVTMIGAFATEDGTEAAVVATVEPTAEPVVETTEEPAAEATEEPVADPTEEPVVEATEEPVVEATEEPAVEATEEPVVETTEEPVVEATEEPVVEATEEPVVEATEEPVVETTEEPAVEATAEPTAEPTPVPVEGTVEAKLATSGDIYIGDVVKFEAVIEGYTMEYTIQWQYNDGYGWKNVEGADEEELRVEVTEENAEWEWRVAVITEEPAEEAVV